MWAQIYLIADFTYTMGIYKFFITFDFTLNPILITINKCFRGY